MQTLIWGTAQGPGLVTRNPYAGIWLLPVFLTLNHNFLTNVGMGVVIGIAHGDARVFGILATRRNLDACGSSILTQWRWRVADGLMLLLGAGGFTASVLAILPTLSHLPKARGCLHALTRYDTISSGQEQNGVVTSA